MKFNNILELKERLMPALLLKKDSLNDLGYNVPVDTIWNFLKDLKWKNATDLSLNEMVNDILNFKYEDLNR